MRNSVSKERIKNMLLHSELVVKTVFNKVTVVSCRLPNGFVITESSGAVDPANYDEAVGREICLQKIENKLWELEGYVLSAVIDRRCSDHEILKKYEKALTYEINTENDNSRKNYIEHLVEKGVIEEKECHISEGYYKGLRVARDMLNNIIDIN